MNVVVAYPPNIEQIDAVFNVRGKPIIFAWGGTIYNPTGGVITPELIAHESVHGSRQVSVTRDPEEWWARYLVDPEFRLAEELPAHVAQYRRYCSRVADSNKRVRFLFQIAEQFASPTYGSIITAAAARRRIQEGR